VTALFDTEWGDDVLHQGLAFFKIILKTFYLQRGSCV
jgi:hypothetical protein